MEPVEARIQFSAPNPDWSFNGIGRVATDVGGLDNYAHAVAIQRDGRIVVAGDTGGDSLLLRYNVNGSLDESFGTHGVVRIDLSKIGAADSANCVAIQSDGKIVVGGYAVQTHHGFDAFDGLQSEDFVVARFNTNGQLDASYGAGGVAYPGWVVFEAGGEPLELANDRAHGIGIQSDGRAVLVGQSSGSWAIARLNTNGTFDNSFNNSIYSQIAHGWNGDASARRIAIDVFGNIVVGGYAGSNDPQYANSHQVALARFRPDGILDAGFDVDGKVLFDQGSLAQTLSGLAIKPSGEIVLASNDEYGYGSITTLRSNGSHRHTSDGPRLHVYNDVIVMPDDEVVVGLTDYSRTPALFGVNSPFDLPWYHTFGQSNAISTAIAVGADGRKAQVGITAEGGSGWNIAVVSYRGVNRTVVGTFSGQVFLDQDGDAVKDSNETGKPGLRVYVDRNNNGVFDSTNGLDERSVLSDAAGNYSIDLAKGSYQLRVLAPPTFTQTLPTSNAAYGINIAGGQLISGKNFGIRPPTTKATGNSIAGQVFNDLNASGGRSITGIVEPNLAGWRVFIDKNHNGKHDGGEASKQTDASGNYAFDNLAPGSYRVACELKTGWRRTQAAAGFYDVQLVNVTHFEHKDFGVTQRALISGVVFADNNGNKTRETGEKGLGGWRVYLDLNNDGKFNTGDASVLSDAEGKWNFNNLTAGNYAVRIVQQSGFKATSPAGGWRSVTVGAGAVSSGQLFGQRPI